MYIPSNLKKWQKVSDYGGEDLSNWYILVTHTRDSDNLENSNFDTIKQYLIDNGQEICSDVEELNCVLLAYFGHWAVGWVECLMIHESNDTALMIGDDIKDKLNNYPLFDEEDYSKRESNDMYDNTLRSVKDYENYNDIELSDSHRDLMVHEILQNSNELNADYWPNEEELQDAYDIVVTGNMRMCTTCKEYFTDIKPCKCQLPLPVLS